MAASSSGTLKREQGALSPLRGPGRVSPLVTESEAF